MTNHFEVLNTDASTSARRGCLQTLHGPVDTPVFMPVGTQATVKGMTPEVLHEIGCPILLGNTYHLNLRPGSELIAKLGGLHTFMGWDGPILTDSGGFQVFSLAKLREISDEGISFRSHLNGDKFFLGPREVMTVQQNLGSDIAMVLDECPPWPCPKDDCRAAVEHSVRWAGQCLSIAREEGFLEGGRYLYGIVQGSCYKDLRTQCAGELVDMDFPGYAVGGVSVGEPEPEMFEQVSWVIPLLPEDRPRYVMGVGTPPQLLKMIGLGVDMFDCVLPTRAARHGTAYTPHGTLSLRNRSFREDARPLVEGMDNYTCRKFSRAYLRHLFMAGEYLGGVLLTLHNLHFYQDLMRQAREHLEVGDYETWSRQWIERYEEERGKGT